MADPDAVGTTPEALTPEQQADAALDQAVAAIQHKEGTWIGRIVQRMAIAFGGDPEKARWMWRDNRLEQIVETLVLSRRDRIALAQENRRMLAQQTEKLDVLCDAFNRLIIAIQQGQAYNAAQMRDLLGDPDEDAPWKDST